jgi:co-chaperonin GroES (HSP10)
MIIVPGCRLLVRPLKIEDHDKVVRSAMASGIVLPEQDKRKMQSNMDQGFVLQIGAKASLDYIEGVELGSKIGFAKFGGKFITDPDTDETLLVINDEDVICIIKENNDN